MSERPHGKGVVRDSSEGLATSRRERGERGSQRRCNGEKHVHLTNSIHIRRHLHLALQRRGGTGGLMLDARRAAPQLPPLLREVTALEKIRTLQDPGTSSGSEGISHSSSLGSSPGRGHNSRKASTGLIGDPHRDAQALAVELAQKGGDHNPRGRGAEWRRRRRRPAKGYVEVPERVDVRERVKRIERIEQALHHDASHTTATLSGELRKESLIKELKERGRIPRDREIREIPRSDERWEGGPGRREEIARRVIEERGSSISSLSQLLGNHYGSGRSAAAHLNLLDELAERRSSHHGGSLVHSDDNDGEQQLSPMERAMTRPRATLNPASPLHLASLSRGKEELQRPRHLRTRRTRSSEARPRSRVETDELEVSELPNPQNGCGGGGPWDWTSRLHKHNAGKGFHDDAGGGGGVEASLPEQSISSLDSDANALPLIIGEDAHDSDFAGYSIETAGSRDQAPQKIASKRKPSLQTAVKDVPAVEPTATPMKGRVGPRTLSQKYRPKSFREIVGQSVVVKSLATAIAKGKVAPVYLFMGPRGTGKTSAARVFAAGLNCESADSTRRPCGICRECATMALNRSADVQEIDAAATPDLPTLRTTMGSFTPVAGRFKVFIVEGCNALTAEIWNAFLKVLEEPPLTVVFILITTDAEQIPPTATSRCQKFHFLKLKDADIVARLETLAMKEGLDVIEEGALALIAARSDGSLRDAEIVLDQVCLLDQRVSVGLIRELVGLLPDGQILDLLDYALSADTTNTVRTLRELLASGVEPLSLVSQLGTLIADILAGSYDVRRETRRDGFFNRNFSVREEQHRLRQALKILSESEKQLRGASDRAPWLTAALLQFAPDRSFLPSEAGDSAPHSPLAAAGRADSRHSVAGSELPSMDEPEYQTQLGSSMELERQTLQAFVASPGRRDDAIEVEDAAAAAASFTEQKLDQAWARDVPQQHRQQGEYVGEASDHARRAPSEPGSLEFRVYGEAALAELWNQVLREITSRSLKHLLQTHGQLVGAGVAVDGSCAVVELDFDHPRDKHKAERSWRSICIGFQAVLSTAVELRIALSETLVHEGEERARVGETLAELQVGPSSPPPIKNAEIVSEDSNGDYSIRVGSSTANPKQKEIAHDDDLNDQAPHPRGHRRRGAKSRKHRHATDAPGNDQHSPGGITPRRLPPSRRRRGKRNPRPAKTVVPVREMTRLSSLESSSFGGGEIWDSGPQLIVLDRPSGEKKKLLSTMMEEPQSDIEDIISARRKIWEQQRSARIDLSRPAALDRRTRTANAQRGLPRESLRCWKMASPRPEFLMRKTRLKGLRRARGKALFLSMVPCSHSRNARNVRPAATNSVP